MHELRCRATYLRLYYDVDLGIAMDTESDYLGTAFGTLVVLSNLFCVGGVIALLGFRFRFFSSAGQQSTWLRRVWWCIICIAAVFFLGVLAVYNSLDFSDRYARMFFFSAVPFALPIMVSGLIALLLKPHARP
jgi:hypothetical protein